MPLTWNNPGVSLPSPPRRNRHNPDYPQRVAAWTSLLLEHQVLRAVPRLAEYPTAAGRVAWYTTREILIARGKGDTSIPLSMSRVVPPDVLNGELPEMDIHMLRAMQVDISQAAPSEELELRLEYLRQVGSELPTHFLD